MITETIYDPSDLHSGECEWCHERSDELVFCNGAEVCIDCIDAERFCQETMKGL